MDWFRQIVDSPVIARLHALVEEGGALSARGASGSSTLLLSAALAMRTKRPVLLVVAHLDEADEILDEIESLGIDGARLPAMEVLPGESSVNPELLAERLALVRRLADEDLPAVIAAPIQALMQAVPRADRLAQMLRLIRPGDTLRVDELVRWLDATGYRRVETIETAGEFSVRGGIIDIFPPGEEPARIDLFGEEVESLFAIDLDSMGSDRRLDRIELIGATTEQLVSEKGTVSFIEYLPRNCIAVLAELIELTEQGRGYYDRVSDARGILGPPAVFKAIGERAGAVLDINQFTEGSSPKRSVELPLQPLPTFHESAAEAVGELGELSVSHRAVVLCQNAGERQRMQELIEEHQSGAKIEVEVHYLHRGFIWQEEQAPPLALIPYHELLHRYQTRRRIRRITTGRTMDAFVDMQAGDYVVHRDHGIARFVGLRALEGASGASEEYLTLEFSRGSKLNVPATKIDLVQKYIGAFSGAPELSTLGGKKWKKQKEKVSEAVRDLAEEMLQIQASRETLPGIRYPDDTPWQHEFEAEFPYEETDDQLAAIAAVKRDMLHERPMDRLVCGDVGFGKTEVAIRAAFKAAEFGKQVAVLVPTTVLAEQHERTFRQRFADYPFRVETVSRFKSAKEQAAILEELKRGRVDIIIGTHRLLSRDVRFGDLGLVIIDEEQRFGVADKQQLLQFRSTSDVLTLSATPIPRTLHMAMLGLRDISSLTTPPLDRRAIVTEVIPYNTRRLQQAINRELAREGQVFFVHNRVHNIQTVADDVQRMAPDARVIIGHGQMPSRQLESVMLEFVRGKADILVCTTIIESGIDIPTANTMIINDAHMFGLSELHQLRGRVGRYKHRAYCYLLLPKDRTVSETAVKRLRAIESFSMLGAGFKIALRDLEIRGAGNLLGPEQSGHIAAVGYEMYCQLLENAVQELREGKKPRAIDTTVDLGITGMLPKGYIPSDARRMDAYRRVCDAPTPEALEQVRQDLLSAYGELPRRAQTLLDLAELRVGASALGIRTITRRADDIVFRTAHPKRLEEAMAGAKGSLRVVGGVDAANLTEVYYRPPKRYLEPDTLLTVLRNRLRPAETETGREGVQSIGERRGVASSVSSANE